MFKYTVYIFWNRLNVTPLGIFSITPPPLPQLAETKLSLQVSYPSLAKNFSRLCWHRVESMARIKSKNPSFEFLQMSLAPFQNESVNSSSKMQAGKMSHNFNEKFEIMVFTTIYKEVF